MAAVTARQPSLPSRRIDRWRVTWTPWARHSSSSRSSSVRPSAFERATSSATTRAAVMPSLSRTSVADAVAERLLVAEQEPLPRPAARARPT